jgi:hypothetical protein
VGCGDRCGSIVARADLGFDGPMLFRMAIEREAANADRIIAQVVLPSLDRRALLLKIHPKIALQEF